MPKIPLHMELMSLVVYPQAKVAKSIWVFLYLIRSER